MTHKPRPALLRLCRLASLLLVTSLGVVVLMRAAPGYFDDERELSAEHGDTVRSRLETERQQTAVQQWSALAWSAVHGDLGTSRQYGTPVGSLVLPRLRTTARLLLPAVGLGSLVALAAALLSAMARGLLAHRTVTATAALACAVPISVLALFCLISGAGGAAGVLFVLIVARDFRLFSRLLRRHAAAPHLFFARAGGVSPSRLMLRHLLWPMRREVAALVVTSLLVGLNATLPIEVIFGAPGVGQLAWSAAMNRDLPVLLTASLLLSLCVGVAGMLPQQPSTGAAA